MSAITHTMTRLRGLTLLACAVSLLLCGCNAPGSAESPTEPTPSTSESNRINSETDVTVAVPAKDLKLSQFLKAMECAEARAEGSEASIYAGQRLVFGNNPEGEKAFNAVMQLGGGGQYVIYEKAVEMGCAG